MEAPVEKQIEGHVRVCCHTVVWRYWGFEHTIDSKARERLETDAEDRAQECIIDGYSSGNLCTILFFDHDQAEEIRGWWEIEWPD